MANPEDGSKNYYDETSDGDEIFDDDLIDDNFEDDDGFERKSSNDISKTYYPGKKKKTIKNKLLFYT
jgi:hypothetical protein